MTIADTPEEAMASSGYRPYRRVTDAMEVLARTFEASRVTLVSPDWSANSAGRWKDSWIQEITWGWLSQWKIELDRQHVFIVTDTLHPTRQRYGRQLGLWFSDNPYQVNTEPSKMIDGIEIRRQVDTEEELIEQIRRFVDLS